MADNTNLLSGKLKIAINDTDLLDGKVVVQSKSTNLLDGLVFIYDDIINYLDGKMRLHDGTKSLVESDKKKIAKRVWDRQTSRHKLSGSFGLKVNRAIRFLQWLGIK